MSTPAEKLQKLVENKQQLVNIVNSKASTSFNLQSNFTEVINTVNNLIGLPLEVNELPTLGTVVPTSGMIERVYVNTSLSTQEVVNILETLTFVPYQNDAYIWACLADSSMINGLAVTRFQSENSFIYYIVSTLNNEMTTLFTYVNGSDDGWSSDFNGVIEFNIENQLELVAPNLGFTPENEKAKNLFSITPFGNILNGAVYAVPSSVTNGTAVPNSGYAENIYVNTNLSPEEVLNLFASLDYYKEKISQNNYFAYFPFVSVDSNDNNSECLIIIQDNAIAIQYASKDLSGTILAYGEGAESQFGFSGWNPEFNGIIPLNQTLTDGQFEDIKFNDVGIINDQLTDLFSMTPFEKDYYLYEEESFTQLIPEDKIILGLPLEVKELPSTKQAVPVSGMVETISFNTSMSTEEVVNFIDKLTENVDWSMEVTTWYHKTIYVFLSSEAKTAISYVKNSAGHNNAEQGVITYRIQCSVDGKSVDVFDSTNGWYGVNSLTVNAENIIGSYGFTQSQNDRVKDLIFTQNNTVTDGAIYKVDENGIVPNTGAVEKVYFNTSMSTEEVVGLLSQLTYTNSEFVLMPVYGLLFKHEYVNDEWNDLILGIFKFDDSTYAIVDYDNMLIYFASGALPDMPLDFVGWNPSLSNEVVIEGEVVDSLQDVPFGLENDKLTNLFSTTPNFGSTGVSKYYLCENNNFKELLTPTGSLEITKSGTYDVTKYVEITIKDTGTPVTVTTAAAMEALLIAENEGKIFLYTGEDTEIYKNGKMYIVEEI